MSVKKIYFVRHGEAEGNVGGFTQSPNTPLTEVGHRQAATVAKRFQSLPIQTVMASYMDRAQDTARYIATAKNLSLETTEFFHEWLTPTSVRGALHTSEMYQAYSKATKEFYTDPDWRFEDGENFTDILTRITNGIAMLEERDEEQVVVVTHGRVLRFLMSYLLHKKVLTPDVEMLTATSMEMSNTGITVFEVDGTSWKLVTWNDHAHFAE